MILPSMVHPALSKSAVDDFLTLKRWRDQASRYGWGICRHDDLVLIATVPARARDGSEDEYKLRLTCDFYPTHPPDVRFVNPETLEYDPHQDIHHLPQLQAPYCAVHPIYGYLATFPYGPQLVCSSVTLGYYFSGHIPTPEEIWVPDRDSIGTSIHTVYMALRSEHYNGRYARQLS